MTHGVALGFRFKRHAYSYCEKLRTRPRGANSQINNAAVSYLAWVRDFKLATGWHSFF